MSDSFLGRWSNRKLQKKAPIEPEVAMPPKLAAENDLSQDNDPAKLENPAQMDNLSPVNTETNLLESNVIPAIPESASPSDNPIGEVVSESSIEHPQPKTGEMDTSSNLDNDKDNRELEPLLSDADMPEIQTLDAGSDISAFFNRGVSKTLRNAALKHIFGLSAYNVRDGLNDYDEDYTVFEPLGDTVTCDMKFHKERKEKLLAEEQARLEELEEQARLEQQDALDEQESQQELSDDEAQQSAEDDQDEITLAESEADSEPAGPHVESDAALLNPEDGLVDVSPLENLSFDNASVESPDVHDQLAQECQDGEPCETTNQADETGHKKTRVLPPS